MKPAELTESRQPREESPVWEVYDLLRTAKLNDYYYTSKANRISKQNTWLEIFLAITVPTSAVAGLSIWKQPELVYVWITLTSIAAFVAVAKPFIKLQEKAQRYTEATSNYRILFKELNDLRSDVASLRTYDQKSLERFQYIRDKLLPVALNSEPVEIRDSAMVDNIQERVNEELPRDRFFIP